jgi:cAMP-dependent protein kinase regulator
MGTIMISSHQISPVEIDRMINKTPIFSGFDDHEHHMLIEKCSLIDVAANEVIIKQGDIGDRLYIIVKGRILISRKGSSGQMTKIAILNDGDVLGEIAIVRNIPRTAFATTLTPCVLLTVTRFDFEHMYPYFTARSKDNIQLLISKRLQQLQ